MGDTGIDIRSLTWYVSIMTEKKRSLLEYISTDAFAILYLTGGVDATRMAGPTMISAFARDFDPDVVSSCQRLGTITEDLPTMISCNEVKFAVNQDGDLDSPGRTKFGIGNPSFSCNTMSLTWRTNVPNEKNPDPIVLVTTLNRNNGPAHITVENLKFYHNDGVLTSVRFDTMKCMWYRRGNLYRQYGPHSMTIINFKGTFNDQGDLYATAPPNYSMLWNHPADGSNITSQRERKIAKEFEVPINYLSPTETVFDNPMEEMVFYSNV